MVPSIAVTLRDGSFALAFFGRMRKLQESAFAVASGRRSCALKRIVVLVILLDNTNRVPAKQQLFALVNQIGNPSKDRCRNLMFPLDI